MNWTPHPRAFRIHQGYAELMILVAFLISVGAVGFALVQGKQTATPQYFVAMDKSYTEPIPHGHYTNRTGRRAILKIGFNNWGFLEHAVSYGSKPPWGMPYNFAN